MAPRKQRPPESTKSLENMRLLDVDGESVRLGTLWEDGPAVLIWLRHYG